MDAVSSVASGWLSQNTLRKHLIHFRTSGEFDVQMLKKKMQRRLTGDRKDTEVLWFGAWHGFSSSCAFSILSLKCSRVFDGNWEQGKLSKTQTIWSLWKIMQNINFLKALRKLPARNNLILWKYLPPPDFQHSLNFSCNAWIKTCSYTTMKKWDGIIM